MHAPCLCTMIHCLQCLGNSAQASTQSHAHLGRCLFDVTSKRPAGSCNDSNTSHDLFFTGRSSVSQAVIESSVGHVEQLKRAAAMPGSVPTTEVLKSLVALEKQRIEVRK